MFLLSYHPHSKIGGQHVPMLLHARPNQGGGVLSRWRRQRRKGKLVQIMRKFNEERINDKMKLTPLLLVCV